jgi:hypothetical protein
MNFKALAQNKFQLLQEKNYSYSIPTDKELMMYDFYTMTYMDAMVKEGKMEPGVKTDTVGRSADTTTHAMGVKQSTLDSFEHIKKQIIDYLKPELLESVFYSVACEFRHAYDNNSISQIESTFPDPIDQKIFTKWKYYYTQLQQPKTRFTDVFAKKEEERRIKKKEKKHEELKQKSGETQPNQNDYLHSYIAARKTCAAMNIPDEKFVQVARDSFNRFFKRENARVKDQDYIGDDNEEWWAILDEYVASYKKWLKYRQAKEDGTAQADWERNKGHRAKQEMFMFKKYGVKPGESKSPNDSPLSPPPEPPKHVEKDILDQYTKERIAYEKTMEPYEKEKLAYDAEIFRLEKLGQPTDALTPPVEPKIDPPKRPKWSVHGKQLSWTGGFGGRPWWEIANAWLKLNNAKTEFQNILYIDNIYHQQHNNDTVFNKLRKYNKNGYGWILNALNFKADAKENWERIKKNNGIDWQ